MSSPDTARKTLSVVVIDDTPDLRDLLKMALERRGEFSVVAEAANGRDGIEVAHAAQPDVILLDIAMPVMDGLEALPLIRETCPRSTVLMLSGFGAAEMTDRALALGADGYIQKGQSMRTMLALVREHADLGVARRSGRDRTGGGGATSSTLPLQRRWLPMDDDPAFLTRVVQLLAGRRRSLPARSLAGGA